MHTTLAAGTSVRAVAIGLHDLTHSIRAACLAAELQQVWLAVTAMVLLCTPHVRLVRSPMLGPHQQ
jgi:hypothetical protein